MRNITIPSVPIAISPARFTPPLFPLGRPSSGPTSPTPATRTKSKEEPRLDGMLLINEAGLRRRNPSWPLVEQVVRELDPGDGNSFACVSLPGNTFMQTLQGRNHRRLLSAFFWGDHIEPLRRLAASGLPLDLSPHDLLDAISTKAWQCLQHLLDHHQAPPEVFIRIQTHAPNSPNL
ncbi:MAG: hypothetical protein O3A92_14160 [Verrucomicrobia bacterium]|nr:hypothetical protein [Verrucomicrobiota bacterium]